jgi:hypothetical protein
VGAGPQKTYTVQKQPAAATCHYRYLKGEPIEDPTCTPGAVSPAVTQSNLKSTICRKGGYTSGIRPSTSVTGREKKPYRIMHRDEVPQVGRAPLLFRPEGAPPTPVAEDAQEDRVVVEPARR